MGYVFTPEEFNEGKIPRLNDYDLAIGFIYEQLSRLYKSGYTNQDIYLVR
jgi:hypothetical protein